MRDGQQNPLKESQLAALDDLRDGVRGLAESLDRVLLHVAAITGQLDALRWQLLGEASGNAVKMTVAILAWWFISAGTQYAGWRGDISALQEHPPHSWGRVIDTSSNVAPGDGPE